MTSRPKSETSFPKTQNSRTSSKPCVVFQSKKWSLPHSWLTTPWTPKTTLSMIENDFASHEVNSEPKSSMTIMMHQLLDTKVSNELTRRFTECFIGLE